MQLQLLINYNSCQLAVAQFVAFLLLSIAFSVARCYFLLLSFASVLLAVALCKMRLISV
jgi:hypothetical protein